MSAHLLTRQMLSSSNQTQARRPNSVRHRCNSMGRLHRALPRERQQQHLGGLHRVVRRQIRSPTSESHLACGPFVDQLRQDFECVGARKCDTHKALDSPTFRFGTRRSVVQIHSPRPLLLESGIYFTRKNRRAPGSKHSVVRISESRPGHFASIRRLPN